MARIDPPKPSLNDLMAAVGYVILQWAYLEQALDSALDQLNAALPNGPQDGRADGKPPKNGFLAKLTVWEQHPRLIAHSELGHLLAVRDLSESIAKASKKRNALCHQLSGARAHPNEKEAYITVKVSGAEIRYGFSELSQLIEEIEQCRHELTRLTKLRGITSRA